MIDCGQINTEKQNTSRYFCLFLITAFHYTHCGFEAIFKWLQIFLLVEFIYHILCNIKTVGQVNFEDRESLMFFQRVLLKSGTIDKLREAGCKDGDTVSMYDFEFDFVG